MESALEKANRDRRREQRRSLAITLLMKVWRAAAVIEAGAVNEEKGIYRINPGDMLHLRRCLSESRAVTQEEGVIG